MPMTYTIILNSQIHIIKKDTLGIKQNTLFYDNHDKRTYYQTFI